MVRYKTWPPRVVRRAESSSIVGVEELKIRRKVEWAPRYITAINAYLVEPHVVTEMRIIVKLRAPPVCGPSTFHVATEDVDNSMLDFLGDGSEVHIIATTCRTFHLDKKNKLWDWRHGNNRKLHLKIITIVLVEPLQALDEQEICREPYSQTASDWSTMVPSLTYKSALSSSNFHQTYQTWSPQANTQLRSAGRGHPSPMVELHATLII